MNLSPVKNNFLLWVLAMSFKDSFKATLRVAGAIFLSLLALLIVGVVTMWAMDYQKKQEAKPFEEMKFWSLESSGNLGLGFVVRTKLVEGKMMFVVLVTGSPNYLNSPLNQDREFTFEFHDVDGFQLYSRAVKVADFTSIVGGDGERNGLTYQFSDYVDVDTYSRFSRFDVKWNLDLSLGKEVAPVKPIADVENLPNIPQLDHCAPGLSKSERLKRLGRHGDVRETGANGYRVGVRSLGFSYDGSLLYCN